MIGVIVDVEPAKYSKDTGKRSQASVSKAKEKETFDLESLTCTFKTLSNDLEELKQRSRETNVSRGPPNFNLFRRDANFGSSSNQPANFAQSANIVLNIESMGMDQYCSYH